MIYAMGAVMNWSSEQVDKSSMWQFFVAWDGYVEANTPKDEKKLSDAEADDLFNWLMSGSKGPRTLSTQTYIFNGKRLVPDRIVTFVVD